MNGNVLKGIMFVGANASGKSNAILAVKFLLDCLFGKNEMNMDSYICMFSGEPVMTLDYAFEIEGTEIRYCITYQRVDKILNEELCVDGVTVFSRNGSVAKVSIQSDVTHTDVPKDSLFLRDIYFNTKFRGNEKLQKWFVFLSNSVYLDLYRRELTQYRDLDLSLKAYMENGGAEKINSFFKEHNFEQSIEFDNQPKGNRISVESAEEMVFFKRKGIDERMPFIFESLGNRNLLYLFPVIFHCISQGGMLILDDFSNVFHNELERLLLRYFMNYAGNGQIIFISHSTNLLSNSILRPDQIYSVDFDHNGSKIKRFSSEKPREAQNLEKMYLGGVFGEIPKYERSFE